MFYFTLNQASALTFHCNSFARAGWVDGKHEPWDFTDIDHYGQVGVSINGKSWGRPDDTVGIAGVINGISANHAEFLNLGGIGILVGDGQLRETIGLRRIDFLTAKYFRTCYRGWRAAVEPDGELRVRRAYGCIQMVKILLGYRALNFLEKKLVDPERDSRDLARAKSLRRSPGSSVRRQAIASFRIPMVSRRVFSASGNAADHSASFPCNGSIRPNSTIWLGGSSET